MRDRHGVVVAPGESVPIGVLTLGDLVQAQISRSQRMAWSLRLTAHNPVWIVSILFRLDNEENEDRLFAIDHIRDLDKIVKDHADCGTIVNIVVMANEFTPVEVRKKAIRQ